MGEILEIGDMVCLKMCFEVISYDPYLHVFLLKAKSPHQAEIFYPASAFPFTLKWDFAFPNIPDTMLVKQGKGIKASCEVIRDSNYKFNGLYRLVHRDHTKAVKIDIQRQSEPVYKETTKTKYHVKKKTIVYPVHSRGKLVRIYRTIEPYNKVFNKIHYISKYGLNEFNATAVVHLKGQIPGIYTSLIVHASLLAKNNI